MTSEAASYDLPVEGGPSNGKYVTWRELNLALDPLKQQGDRIEKVVNLLYGHWFENIGAERERKKSKDARADKVTTRRFWALFIAGLLGAGIATAVTILLIQ